MAKNDGSAEIFEINDARRRLRAGDLKLDDFPTAGAYLAAVREALGFSSEEIAEKLHMKASVIAAIEENAIDDLPARPYAVGFVKSFAEALGVPGDVVVDRFKSDVGFTPQADLERAREPIRTPAANAPAEPANLSLAAVVVILMFIMWCAFEITRPRSVNQPFKLDGVTPAPADPAAGAAIIDPDEAALVEAPAPGLPPQELPIVVEARIIERFDPIYPRNCEREARPVETVNIAFTITAVGGVSGERILESSSDCFERASLNAIRRWRFQPRTIDGESRPAYEQRVSFSFDKPD
ncbi:MAG: TonB family protein [Pseudomonadota bacterium]